MPHYESEIGCKHKFTLTFMGLPI